MKPIVDGTASPGNSGRDFPAIRSTVALRILDIVRERFPLAEVVESEPEGIERGATYLLVPIITEWKAMRTDDPVGALILPHNSVSLTLRVMRLNPPALVGEVIFRNHARLTLNQRAERLLDARFRQVVMRLIVGATT